MKTKKTRPLFFYLNLLYDLNILIQNARNNENKKP